MSFETILTEQTDGLLTITLNRPERLNAWTYQMAAELTQAIETANDDDDVIAMIVTGAGRGFCAGADIGDVFKAQAEGGGSGSTRRRSTDWVKLIRGSKPMVAAINGAAIGVGLTQLLPMDYLVAASGAKLSMRFIKMGLVPELASSHFLGLRCGFGRASRLMLSGRTITAEEAAGIGLIDEVASPEQLLTTAAAVAREMGENPQAALRMVKSLITDNVSEVGHRSGATAGDGGADHLLSVAGAQGGHRRLHGETPARFPQGPARRLKQASPAPPAAGIVTLWLRCRFWICLPSAKAWTPARRCATAPTWPGTRSAAATAASGSPSTTICPASPAPLPPWPSAWWHRRPDPSGSAPAASCSPTTRRW